MSVATGPTRAQLVVELTEVVGAPHEARFIVDEALGLGLVLGNPDAPTGHLDERTVAAARAMAARRVAGEPLQYVFGHWPFRMLDLVVDDRVLIPRPETERVVEVALAEARRLGPGLVTVDAGTGSGAIALSLAAELGRPRLREVWATDASVGALAVARANLEALHRRARGASPPMALPPVALVAGDWLEPLPARLSGAVDLVVSNPPYVTAAEWHELEADVRTEPRSALVAGVGSEGTDGLADVESVLTQSRQWLGRPGAVVVEVAPHQAEPAASLARHLGYDEVAVEPDLTGRSRAVVARIGS